MTKILLTAKDGSIATLAAGISAAATSIPLASGKGALFPQPYNGAATSAGSATVLNSTGISAAIGGAAAVGKFVYNATDGSWAKIVTVNTNDVVMTRLNGGTDNVWDNSDKWYIDPFIGTLAVVSTSTYGVKTVTASERVLIIGRATDTLTVATGGRGYDGTTSRTFEIGDSFSLNVNAATMNNVQEVLLSTQTQIDTNLTALNTLTTRVGAVETGSFYYVVTTGSANAYVASTPAFSAYAAGNKLIFKANFACTGACTINVNGLGAKTIKRLDGATDTAANDIKSGQIVELVYDGTNFQMLTPAGTVSGAPWTNILNTFTVSTDTINSTTSEITISNASVDIPANTLAVGDTYEFIFRGYASHAAGSSLYLRPYVGACLVSGGSFNMNTNSGSPTQGTWEVTGYFQVVSIGAGGTIVFKVQASRGKGANDLEAATRYVMTQANQAPVSLDTTATVTVKLTAQTDNNGAGNYCRCIQATVRKLLV